MESLARAGAGAQLGRAVDTQNLPTEGPQLMTRLQGQVKNLYELHSRLQEVNRQLRGTQPPPPNEKGMIEKEPEVTLNYLVATISALTERCHYELNEISALLS